MARANAESPVFTIRELNSPWREVLNLATRQVCAKSHCWIDEGVGSTFSFLHRGRVRLVNVMESGQERILLDIEQGCIFREVPVFHVSLWYPGNFLALEKCEVYHFPRSLLEDEAFIRAHPVLMSNLVRSLGIKAGAFFSQISESSHLSPQEKVCRYLRRLADQNAGRARFAPGVSQSEMAETLGLHRSTVCRVISELRDEGVIGNFSRRNLEIFKPDALCRAQSSIPH